MFCETATRILPLLQAPPLQPHHVFACAIGGHLRGTGAGYKERQAGFCDPGLQSLTALLELKIFCFIRSRRISNQFAAIPSTLL